MGEASTRGTVATPLVLRFGEPRCNDRDLVGRKAARLSELSEAFSVPDGFCVTVGAHSEFVEAGGLPSSVQDAVLAAYDDLSDASRSGGEAVALGGAAVAVRSSAADEDGMDASFAGQHETYLNVTGGAAVLQAIEAVWRSAHTETVLAYRRDRGLSEAPLALAVIVQRLVESDASGVAFSVDPVSGDRDKVVLNANWGLGESLVDGGIEPDRWVFSKTELRLLDSHVGGKERMTITSAHGAREVKTPALLRQKPSLDDDHAVEVARLTKELERLSGHPVDVEFAFEADRLWLLQCRPVTTLAPSSPATAVQR